MATIKVNLADKSYDVQIEAGILKQVPKALATLGFAQKTVIITNPAVKCLYGDKLRDELKNAGFDTALFSVPDGEAYKSLDQAGKLFEQLADFQTERNTPVLALGGGVIGDLSGFVAATYMRGVPLIQIPTTLLSLVDSSVGGKVAVNHGHLKNNIGTFYQPRLVIADSQTLSTLPETEIRNGLAEVIKYGAIRDAELFKMLEAKPKPLADSWDEIITRCVAIKAEIVAQDESDLGIRNILNFGHTIGHALETVSNYKLKHGQGVAIGMVAAAIISERSGFCSHEEVSRLKQTVIAAGLPARIPHLDIKKIIQAMQHDKKKVDGRVRFILIKSIGEAFIYNDIGPDLLSRLLQELND
jgi:3-dehydroquinate synthase